MAYEVTKRIKGHEYRYRVASERDPHSGRARLRWQYLGRLDAAGRVLPARTYAPRTTAGEIVAATAHLLRRRDAAHVTVAVIAQQAGISTGTFYRHFHDRRSVLDAAVALLLDELIAALPSLDGPIGAREAERERLFGWFAALQAGALDGRALRWLLTRPGRDDPGATDEGSPARTLQGRLAEYFRALDAHGAARITDPDALAAALLRLHLSFVRDLASAGDASGESTLRWSEVFPVIERAVFPHEIAA